jgi:hypothetical protein
MCFGMMAVPQAHAADHDYAWELGAGAVGDTAADPVWAQVGSELSLTAAADGLSSCEPRGDDPAALEWSILSLNPATNATTPIADASGVAVAGSTEESPATLDEDGSWVIDIGSILDTGGYYTIIGKCWSVYVDGNGTYGTVAFQEDFALTSLTVTPATGVAPGALLTVKAVGFTPKATLLDTMGWGWADATGAKVTKAPVIGVDGTVTFYVVCPNGDDGKYQVTYKDSADRIGLSNNFIVKAALGDAQWSGAWAQLGNPLTVASGAAGTTSTCTGKNAAIGYSIATTGTTASMTYVPAGTTDPPVIFNADGTWKIDLMAVTNATGTFALTVQCFVEFDNATNHGTAVLPAIVPSTSYAITNLTPTPATAAPGDVVTLLAEGFVPGETLTVTGGSSTVTPATAPVVGPNGTIKFDFTVPAGTADGPYWVKVQGKAPQSATAAITVKATPGGGGTTPPPGPTAPAVSLDKSDYAANQAADKITSGGAAGIAGVDSLGVTVNLKDDNGAPVTLSADQLKLIGVKVLSAGSTDASGVAITCVADGTVAGQYNCALTSANPGLFVVTVTYNGQPIMGASNPIPIRFIGITSKLPAKIYQGDTIKVSSYGWLGSDASMGQVGDEVTAFLHSDPIPAKTITVDQTSGVVTATFVIPADFPTNVTHCAQFIGTVSGSVQICFKVLKVPAPEGGAVSGSPAGPLGAMALLLALGIGVGVFQYRRRVA